MFGISYNTWINTCKMYFDLGNEKKALYLQWFPFTKLSISEQRIIMSEGFYNKYIKTGAFVLFPDAMHCSENYIQKNDGSFRDSSLLAPILYLVLQAVGKEVSMLYSSQRGYEIDVFYGGNYEEMRPYYKQDYDMFYKMININIEDCRFFIKTDLASFFSSINIDLLVKRIDDICNNESITISQTQLSIIKELLLYCGRGRFPLVENSIASSYLATVVYLDEIDNKLSTYIKAHISAFTSYRIIRYVDDMYILISSDKSEKEILEAYNKIRNEYSSILKEYGLALNTQKCCLKPASEINDELKKSLYDEFFCGEKHKIGSLFTGSLASFLGDLLDGVSNNNLDINKYNNLIEKHFSNDGIEFTSSEVYNYLVYEDETEVKSPNVIDIVIKMIRKDITFISFDPKRLSVIILHTHNEMAIKALLNQLFARDRAGLWNSYDTIIAISYLIQSEFKHRDLISTLRQKCKDLDVYYYNYCARSFLHIMLSNRKLQSRCLIIGNDWKAIYLYFMYFMEKRRHNNLAQYAFYRNYFDRLTADLAFYVQKDKSDDVKPNYERYYRENDQKKFFAIIPNSDKILKRAHKMRNANPLSHASAELIDKNSTSNDIDSNIVELEEMIDKYIIEKHIY